MFTKLGESFELKIESTDSCASSIDPELLENFRKTAADLKKVAPKADDFLYFSAAIIHAAESSALNDDGTLKTTASGEPVEVGWDTSNGTWRWKTNDHNILPYKNNNHDIFPELELIKAHKKWIGKPLCIDHKSNSVDHVRGFIVDTYYDRNLKRVIALCALDKKNYPDLARKVSTGYSNNVSMGTAVATAICTECARCASTEADFCEHMKRKSGYGEINIGLNPLELSIVVNGADPKAYIKNVIAAANTLNNYVNDKEKEFAKIAQEGQDAGELKSKITSVIDEAVKKLEDIKKDFESTLDSNNVSESFEQTGSNTPIGVEPTARFASIKEEDYKETLKNLTSSIEIKLNNMKESLDKLLTIKEGTMSGSNEMNKKGYYLGTEEPSPGQPKYSKDPMNEDLREHQDKQMVGQMDIGPIDGMNPGPDSVGMSELERKKMLARAESEERALRRNAIVSLAKQALEDKKAYFQGGGGVNEPTPGKVKYPKDPINENLREKFDKQMVGQKPFPGVGPVDGMHPSPVSAETPDEKKRKELLQRASLRARFTKAANNDGTQDLGKSAWEVFLGDKLLLTASVDELSGGRSEMLYDSIATKEFGSKLIEKVKVHGVDKVRSFVKSAQDSVAPAAPAVAPAAPADVSPPAEPAIKEMDDSGKNSDPKEQVKSLIDKLTELSSDLKEAFKLLVGEKEEMGDMGGDLGAAASFGSSTLNTLRVELNGALTQAMKEAVAQLNSHKDELEMIVGLFDKGVPESNKDMVNSIVEDAVSEAKSAVADSFKLMTAFVKYARGTQAIVKRAEIESDLQALAEDEGDVEDVDANDDVDVNADEDDMQFDDDLNSIMKLLEDKPEGEVDVDVTTKEGDEEDEGEGEGDTSSDESTLEGEGDMHDLTEKDMPEEEFEGLEGDLGDVDDNDALQLTQEQADKALSDPNVKVNVASFNTAEGRVVMRAKLAAEALKFSPMLDAAHPKGGFTTDLDVKPTGDLAKIEDLEEEHVEVLDVATAPVKVRKEAENINRLVCSGELNPADLDALVAEGLDKDAVAYWKKYYGQVDGGSEFASELVKEHVKAQLEEELNKYRVKIARAYELTYDMISRGLCSNNRSAISDQVDEIMKFNDEGFDTLKRVVAKHAPVIRKEATMSIPQVGLIDSGDIVGSASSNGDDNLFEQLSLALSKTSRKMF
jgi:hypothetical protein